MADSKSIDLQTEWEQGCCPDVNGIMFPDGRVKLIDVETRESSAPDLRFFDQVLHKKNWTTLNEIANCKKLERISKLPEDDD